MSEFNPSNPVKILFVDDEENILKALHRTLFDEDFVVMTANSGEEALQVLADNRDMAVIVSDQRMPGLSGVDFLEKARKITPEALKIILTGYADITAVVDAINRGGAFRYIAKPWKDEELIQILKDAAYRYCLLHENSRLSQIIKKQNEELKNWNSQLEIMVQEQSMDLSNRNTELQKLNKTIQMNFTCFIEAFSSLIDMRDKSVSNHSKNVAILAKQTATALSLSEHDINDILIAALLHDIGKIGVSDLILMKNYEEMDADEQKEYQLHPVRGQVAVEIIEGFQDVGILIRHHHERVDGLGFPDGLMKNDIPLGSRIIAIADAADRIAACNPVGMDNAYRVAISEISAHLDKKFDRDLFAVMRPLLIEKAGTITARDYLDEVEIHPDKLMHGMVLSKDIKSGTGLLLLACGTVLEQKAIVTIQHFHTIDPFRSGVYVLREREKGR